MIMDCWGGAKIKCEFSKTQINTDNIVLKTIFHNVPDSTLYIKPETIRKEVEQAFFDAATVLTDFSIKDTVKIDKPYTYLYINESGKVVAVSVNNNGKTEEKNTEISATNLKGNTLIQGKNGEELVLTKKGQVMGKTEFNATGGNSVLLKEYHRKSDSLAQWQINFSKYDAQTYAFDHIGSGNHGIFSSSEYYPQVGSYDFRYKSVECGKNDKVIVEFDTYREKDSVVFKDKYGVTYPIKDRILTFTGVNQADTNFIYAYRGDQKIGKLFLNTYQQKTYKVVFVRVNGAAKKINEKNLVKYLNKVYKQCAVSFKDSTDEITINELKEFSHGGSGVLTVYNNDQKTVLNAYDKRMKDGVYYLFFVDEVKDKKDGSGTSVSGYMPRGYNCGFIYDGGSERTIAHELGHGIAGLEHVFENSNNSGKTNNLMDYSIPETATELWHFQWDQIQDPSRVWMKWNKAESEGEERTAYKYLVNVFSPYFSQKIIVNVENLQKATTESEKQKYRWRIYDLLNSCDTKQFSKTEKEEIISRLKNKEAIDLDYLVDHNSAMVVYPGKNTIPGTFFKLICGTPDVAGTENFTSINGDLTVKYFKNILPVKYIDAIFYNNLPGGWTSHPDALIEHKKALKYNMVFTPDGYYSQTITKFKLIDGSIVMRITSYDEGENKNTYKYLGIDNLWYDLQIETFTDANLGKELHNLISRINVEALQTVGRYALPIEDCIILIDGKDFDGVSSSRVLAGVSAVLYFVKIGQAAKFVRVVKGGKYVKYGEEVVFKGLKEALKKYLVNEAPDVVIDVAAQFIINLAEEKEVQKAWSKTSIRNAILQNAFSINTKKDALLEEALYCALEIMSQLESDGIIDSESLTKGSIKCLIECLLLGSKYGLRSKGLLKFVQNEKNRQRLLDFFKDSKFYSLMENLLKDYGKQGVERY